MKPGRRQGGAGKMDREGEEEGTGRGREGGERERWRETSGGGHGRRDGKRWGEVVRDRRGEARHGEKRTERERWKKDVDMKRPG